MNLKKSSLSAKIKAFAGSIVTAVESQLLLL